MYRSFVFGVAGRQWQRAHSVPLHRLSATVLPPSQKSCRLLRSTFLPSTSSFSARTISRSLKSSGHTSSGRRKPPLTHSPDTPPPATSATSTAVTWAAANDLLSSVLQSVFGRHSSPFRLYTLFSLVLLCHLFVFDLFTGHGPSMLPTFAMSGEVFVVEAVSRYTMLDSAMGRPESARPVISRLVCRLFAIGRGDVVLCTNPVRAQHAIAKRVVGMPGDMVRSSPNDPASLCSVPAGHVWLQGDCLEASRDSREYGAVPMWLVRGKVVAKIWPVSKAMWIERTLKYRGY